MDSIDPEVYRNLARNLGTNVKVEDGRPHTHQVFCKAMDLVETLSPDDRERVLRALCWLYGIECRSGG